MYKTIVSDFGYNRIFYIIEYGHWMQINIFFERFFIKTFRKIRHFMSISICLYTLWHRDLCVWFLAELPDLIMICRRFLYNLDIESIFEIFYHFNQKFLGKIGKNRDKVFVYYLFLKFKIIEYFYNRIYLVPLLILYLLGYWLA